MIFKEPVYSNSDNTQIDLQINHETYGWIPCTITAEEYPALWATVVASEVKPYAEPDEQQLELALD